MRPKKPVTISPIDDSVIDFEAYKAIYQHAAIAILIIRDNAFIDCNARAEEVLGRTRDMIVGHSPIEFSPKFQADGQPSVTKARRVIKAAQSGTPQAFEWLHSKPDGSLLVAKINLNSIVLQDKRYISVFIDDITDYKRNLSELELYQSDLESVISEKSEELVRANAELTVANEELAATNEELAATNEELMATNEELSVALKNLNRENLIRKQLHELLVVNQEKFRSFIDQSAEGISIIDTDANIIEWNRTLEHITGVKYVEVVGKKAYDIELIFFPEEERNEINGQKIREQMVRYLANIEKQKPFSYDVAIQLPDGARKTIATTIFPIKIGSKYLVGRLSRDITELRAKDLELEGYRNRLEELVQEKTRQVNEISGRFYELFTNTSDGIFYIDQVGDKLLLTRANPVIARLIGLPPDVYIPSNLQDVIPGAYYNKLRDSCKKCFAGGNPVKYEERFTQEGVESFWSILLIPLPASDGESNTLAGFCRDITVERRIVAEQEFSRAIFENTHSVIVVVNGEGRVIGFNRESETLSGYSAQEVWNTPFWELPVIPADTRAILKGKFQTLLDGSCNFFENFNYWIMRSGEKRWLYWTNTCIRNDDGSFNYMVATGTDLTERKVYEERLRDSEMRFRLLYETMHDGITLIKPEFNRRGTLVDFRILGVNPSLERILGLPSNQLQGQLLSQIAKLPPELKALGKDVLKHGKSGTYEGYSPTFRKYVSISVFRYLEGQLAAVVRDITTQKNVENALINSEAKFRSIFSSSQDGIAIVSTDFRLLEANPALQQLLQQNDEEIYKGVIFDNIGENYHPIIVNAIEMLLAGKTVNNLEIELISSDGGIIPVELSATVIDYHGDRALLATIRNITERKEMEKLILRTIIETEERERRRLAADLHDDIGPLLASLKMYVSTLQQKLAETSYSGLLEVIMTLIKNSIENVRTISNNISPHLLERYGLVSAVNAEIENNRLLLPIKFHTNAKGLRFEGSVEIIYYRIIKELINNTIKYAQASQASIAIHFRDSKLHLEYADDGVGFDVNNVKVDRTGGHGLTNIANRIRSINGHYTIDSEPGKGILFKFVAPVNLR